MKKRKKMSRKASRKDFRRKASMTHKRNVSARPMRGGICL